MGKKKVRCGARPRCDKPAVYGGLCEEHDKERDERQREESEAIYLLHNGTTHALRPLQNPELLEEFRRLQGWWRKACDSVNFNWTDPILKDEAEFAVDWCISLTKELIKADNALSAGRTASYSLEIQRQHVWGRFTNLEAGLMSNGVKRPENRQPPQ